MPSNKKKELYVSASPIMQSTLRCAWMPGGRGGSAGAKTTRNANVPPPPNVFMARLLPKKEALLLLLLFLNIHPESVQVHPGGGGKDMRDGDEKETH